MCNDNGTAQYTREAFDQVIAFLDAEIDTAARLAHMFLRQAGPDQQRDASYHQKSQVVYSASTWLARRATLSDIRSRVWEMRSAPTG